MKHISSYIIEGLRINKNTKINTVENKIDEVQLKYFTKDDINKIINWVNDMPNDVRPLVITNIRNDLQISFPQLEIYLLYTNKYENSKKLGKGISYISFFYDNEGLGITIYDSKKQIFHNSPQYKNGKDLDKCFDFIKSKYDIIKEII